MAPPRQSIAAPPTPSLLPHQREAVRFALPRRRAYLGLDAGLGKTPVAARVAVLSGMPVVYVTPPFLVRNVENEFERWAPTLRVGIYGKLTPLDFDLNFQHLDVIILPDSLLARDDLQKCMSAFLAGRRGLLVVDEAHRFTNAKAKRTAALLGVDRRFARRPGLVDAFERRLFMSGTPIPNRPMELFPILNKEAPDTIDFMDEWAFGRHFCAGHRKRIGWDAQKKEPRFTWDFKGASNLPELKERLQGTAWPYMLRMRKELLKLPPKIERVFILSSDMSPRLAKLDHAAREVYGDAAAPDVTKRRLAAQHGDDGELHVATYRRLLGTEKVKPVAEYASAILDESPDALLIFAFHVDVVAALAEALAAFDPLVISGVTPKAQRQPLVQEFQTSPGRRLMIGNYSAMGVGFTLTKATRVLFAEFDWVPGVNSQGGDRAHRIGQTKSVLVEYVVFKNSLDKRMIEAVLEKSDATNLI